MLDLIPCIYMIGSVLWSPRGCLPTARCRGPRGQAHPALRSPRSGCLPLGAGVQGGRPTRPCPALRSPRGGCLPLGAGVQGGLVDRDCFRRIAFSKHACCAAVCARSPGKFGWPRVQTMKRALSPDRGSTVSSDPSFASSKTKRCKLCTAGCWDRTPLKGGALTKKWGDQIPWGAGTPERPIGSYDRICLNTFACGKFEAQYPSVSVYHDCHLVDR